MLFEIWLTGTLITYGFMLYLIVSDASFDKPLDLSAVLGVSLALLFIAPLWPIWGVCLLASAPIIVAHTLARRFRGK